MEINKYMRHKIDKRVVELFEKGHIYDDFKNIEIRKDIQDKLYNYQILHTFNMINAIENNKVSIDSSYTGTGKTYTTIAACSQLGLIPFVICPKSIIYKWKEVMNLFNLEYISVVNYESIRSLKYIDNNDNKIDCPYITKNKSEFKWNFNSYNKSNKIVIIFDEVHRCKNHNTLNGKLLLSCKNMKTIMLSATLCDKNKDFGIFGMMLGFYKNFRQGRSWIDSIIRENRNQYSKKKINILHKHIFPEKGSKMTLEDLGDDFPMNQISIDCYTLNTNNIKNINNYYDKICSNLSMFSLKELNDIRQKIENEKVIILIELIYQYYEQNKSVVVFVNYISTQDMILTYLDKKKINYSIIRGNQTEIERRDEINKFQNNEVRIMISMIQAGGEAVSLHDITGRFPRVSIISPSYSSIELTQALGRIYRAGIKTPCLQKIVYCAGTYEENVAKIIKSKNNFLKSITDEDMNIESNIIMYDLNKKIKTTIKNNNNVKSTNNNKSNNVKTIYDFIKKPKNNNTFSVG